MKNKLLVSLVIVAILVTAGGYLLFRGPGVTQKPSPQPGPFVYGIKIESFGDLNDIQRFIQEISQLGVKDVTMNFVWALVETQNNTYDWSRYDQIMSWVKQYGINMWANSFGTPGWANNNRGWITPPSNPQEYADFVKDVVSRYSTQIKGFEIWNEPNLPGFWKGTPEQYAQMLNLAYDAIKSVNPNLPVISGGLASDNAGWMDRFLNSNPKFDWFGWHPYARYYSPAESSISDYHGILNLKNVKAKLESYGFDDVPILITEFGYSASDDLAGGNVPSWERVGAYLPESFALAQSYDYVKGLFWFHYRGYTGTDYGLVDGNWNKRPGWHAYETMMKILPNYTFETKISGNVDNSGTWLLRFKKENAPSSKMWFMFAPYINNAVVEPQRITINIGSASSGILTDLMGTENRVYPDASGNFELDVRGTPYYLEV